MLATGDCKGDDTMVSHGVFFWNELMTDDVAAAKAFYARVAGWSYEEMPTEEFGTYVVAKAPGVPMPVAGLMHWPADQPGGRDWFAYIKVDDIEALTAETVAAGGRLLRPVFTVPGVGKIALVEDPAKSVIGFIEPFPMP
jgi:predicted enzyme related to lactoylglutathione lyase